MPDVVGKFTEQLPAAAGQGQRRHRHRPRRQPHDQLRQPQQHLRQATGRRPRRSHRPRPRRQLHAIRRCIWFRWCPDASIAPATHPCARVRAIVFDRWVCCEAVDRRSWRRSRPGEPPQSWASAPSPTPGTASTRPDPWVRRQAGVQMRFPWPWPTSGLVARRVAYNGGSGPLGGTPPSVAPEPFLAARIGATDPSLALLGQERSKRSTTARRPCP